MDSLRGKIVLISGTGGGQGRAAALAFAKAGAKVLGCDINVAESEKTLAMVVANGGEMQSMHPLDVSEPDQAIGARRISWAGTDSGSGAAPAPSGGRGRERSIAPFEPPLSPLTWVLWRATWTPPKEGAYRLIVRATDAAGAPQDSHTAPSYPSGSSGYHTFQVNVSR